MGFPIDPLSLMRLAQEAQHNQGAPPAAPATPAADPRALAQQAIENLNKPQAPPPPGVSPMFSNPQNPYASEQYIQQAGRQGVPGQPIPGLPLRQINQTTGAIEPTEGTGRHAKLKRGLSDALYALSTAMSSGIGQGIEAATPQGQERTLAREQLVREQAAAQRIEQTGFGTGLRGAGGTQVGMNKAAIDAIKALGHMEQVDAMLPTQLQVLQSRISNMDAGTALKEIQAQMLPEKMQLDQLKEKYLEAFKNKQQSALNSYRQQIVGIAQGRQNDMAMLHTAIVAHQKAGEEEAAQKLQATYDKMNEQYGPGASLWRWLTGSDEAQAPTGTPPAAGGGKSVRKTVSFKDLPK